MGRLKFFEVRSNSFFKKNSIGRRWAINWIGIILIVMLLLIIGFSVAVKNVYYNSAKQAIKSTAEVTMRLVPGGGSNITNMSEEIRGIIENFEDRDKMTIMAIDHSGRIALNSRGFSYLSNVAIPDYEKALSSDDGVGIYDGKLANGEKVIAVTMLLSVSSGEYSALRFISSTRLIDSNILKMNLIFIAVCVVIILCVLISGGYFINSIVIPVKKIGVAAKRIATGDYQTRIIKNSDDELGELCDTINNMAEQLAISDKVKNDFISSVSHELRTPLTAIKGWGETLQMTTTQDTETIRRGMRVIISETERLSQMVEELLDFSRLQSGNFKMNKSKMDVLAELGEAVLVYAERAKRDDIALQYNEPVMMPFVYGDKNRIKQVFINVIDNAIKYSDKGGLVTVAVESDDDYVTITVTDTGCGIAAADLPRVTEKFFKANHTRRGSGVGLAVANDIIVQHDGEMHLESIEGVGTTVKIMLPVMHEIDVKDEAAADNAGE